MTTDLEKEREAIKQIIIDHLTAVYVCNRVWEAWNVGTMDRDDFEPAQETDLPDELADALMARAALVAPAAPQEQPSDPTCALCRGTGRIGIPGATCPGCDGARQSIACAPKPKLDDGAVARLKLVCRKLGLESAIPDDLYSEPEALFTILGQIRSRVDALLAALQGGEDAEAVAWVRRHPDGALTAEFLEDAVIEPSRKKSGAWVPLYRGPQPAGRDAREDDKTRCSNALGEQGKAYRCRECGLGPCKFTTQGDSRGR